MSHDDVCRGAADGCDHAANFRQCDVCGETHGLAGNPPLCEDCRAGMAAQGYEPCLRCGMPAERYFCSQECEDAERFAGVLA